MRSGTRLIYRTSLDYRLTLLFLQHKMWFLKKISCLLYGLLFFAGGLAAQSSADSLSAGADSLRQADTALLSGGQFPVTAPLPVSRRPLYDTGWVFPDNRFRGERIQWEIMQHHPFFRYVPARPGTTVFTGARAEGEIRRAAGKESFFYSLLFLILLFALIRRSFPKYFTDLFRLFFRTTLKERQISEQLMQNPLPSVLLNGFFALAAGYYICLLLLHFDLIAFSSFWMSYLYTVTGLALAYLLKFAGLKIFGWIFSMEQPARSYIFIVFIINKMIGILLLPFLLVLAFSEGTVYTVGLTLSWCLVAGLIFYRMMLTFGVVRNQVKVSPFHFFLYVMAVEVAPLLLVYKALLDYFRETT